MSSVLVTYSRQFINNMYCRAAYRSWFARQKKVWDCDDGDNFSFNSWKERRNQRLPLLVAYLGWWVICICPPVCLILHVNYLLFCLSSPFCFEQYSEHIAPVTCCTLALDNKYLITSSEDSSIIVALFESGKVVSSQAFDIVLHFRRADWVYLEHHLAIDSTRRRRTCMWMMSAMEWEWELINV